MLKELSPELLQHAADVARDSKRYSQADNLEVGATDTVNSELNPNGDQDIRYTVKSVAWITPNNWSCVLCSDGHFRTSHRYGQGCTTSGTILGDQNVPKEMKTSPQQARKIVAWWKRFGKENLPQLADWHNFVNYGTMEENVIRINESDLRQLVREIVESGISINEDGGISLSDYDNPVVRYNRYDGDELSGVDEPDGPTNEPYVDGVEEMLNQILKWRNNGLISDEQADRMRDIIDA